MTSKFDSAPDSNNFDLNLVRLFVAVFETGSVSRAALRIGITQPSISYGLGRLRREVGDPLFVRSANTMTPTPMAHQLYRQFRDALTAVESAMEGTVAFDALTSHRTFRVAMSDVGAICLVPHLLAALREQAPHATLEVVQVPVKDLMDEMARGHLDAAIGNLPIVHASARSELLFPERYVCLLAANHPRIRGSTLSLEQFLAERHVVVASPFSVHQNVEELLAERGVRRQAALRIASFTILPAIIGASDLLVTLPSALGKVFRRFDALRCLELPAPLPRFEIRVLWHARQQSNPANAWLRKTVIAALADPSLTLPLEADAESLQPNLTGAARR